MRLIILLCLFGLLSGHAHADQINGNSVVCMDKKTVQKIQATRQTKDEKQYQRDIKEHWRGWARLGCGFMESGKRVIVQSITKDDLVQFREKNGDGTQLWTDLKNISLSTY
jgi:hypothetical protein